MKKKLPPITDYRNDKRERSKALEEKAMQLAKEKGIKIEKQKPFK